MGVIGAELVDDTATVPKNTTVLVKRMPASLLAEESTLRTGAAAMMQDDDDDGGNERSIYRLPDMQALAAAKETKAPMAATGIPRRRLKELKGSGTESSMQLANGRKVEFLPAEWVPQGGLWL